MTNYNKSFIQIITQKQEYFNFFKKKLKGVQLDSENKDTAKATGLLEIYKTDNASIDNPETQEVLDQLNNPILASFLSNRILEMRAAHIDIAMNISPQFGEIRLSDLDLYQLLQTSDKAISKLLRPDIKVSSSYLQLDHSQLLAVELPVLTDKVNIDKELNELVKALPNVNYRNGLHSGYLIQIIEIFEPGY